MITYRVTLDVPLQPVIKVSNLLRKRRKELGTRNGTRALTCYQQAVFILAWFRDRPGLSRLGQGFGISQAIDFPHPLGPITATRSPRPISRSTPSTARTIPCVPASIPCAGPAPAPGSCWSSFTPVVGGPARGPDLLAGFQPAQVGLEPQRDAFEQQRGVGVRGLSQRRLLRLAQPAQQLTGAARPPCPPGRPARPLRPR